MTVDELVEQWREQLGLLPWEERADGATVSGILNGDDYAKHSGRTTRGILEALARCQIEGVKRLYIGRMPRELRDHCFQMADDLSFRLGLDTWLRYAPSGRAPAGAVIYMDHAA